MSALHEPVPRSASIVAVTSSAVASTCAANCSQLTPWGESRLAHTSTTVRTSTQRDATAAAAAASGKATHWKTDGPTSPPIDSIADPSVSGRQGVIGGRPYPSIDDTWRTSSRRMSPCLARK
eukprot:scaffold3201_cov116-Isochrysis_galbana.AAC.9